MPYSTFFGTFAPTFFAEVTSPVSSRFGTMWAAQSRTILELNYAEDIWPLQSRPILEYEHAVTITYDDSVVGTPLSITGALVTRERQQRRENGIGGWDTVTTRSARFTTPATTLRLDGVITIGSRDYNIDNIATIEGGRTELQLTRTQVGEVTRAGYRRP